MASEGRKKRCKECQRLLEESFRKGVANIIVCPVCGGIIYGGKGISGDEPHDLSSTRNIGIRDATSKKY